MLTHFEREKLIWSCQLITTNETIALLALNAHVDAEGECWPGQKRLSEMCKFTDRTVRNVCSSLTDKGVIIRNHRYKSGRRTSDKFKIDFSVLGENSICKLPEQNSASQHVLPERDSGSIAESRSGRLPERDSRDLSILDLSSLNYPDSPFNSPKGEERERGDAGDEVHHQNQDGEIMLSEEPQKFIEPPAQFEVITTTDKGSAKGEPVAASDKPKARKSGSRSKDPLESVDDETRQWVKEFSDRVFPEWRKYCFNPVRGNKPCSAKDFMRSVADAIHKDGHRRADIERGFDLWVSDYKADIQAGRKVQVGTPDPIRAASNKTSKTPIWLAYLEAEQEKERDRAANFTNGSSASNPDLMAEFQQFRQEAQQRNERVELVQTGGNMIRYCFVSANGQRDRTQIFQAGTLNMYRQVWALARAAS